MALDTNHAPVPPPSYHRSVASALHLDTLTLVTRLHLLDMCPRDVSGGLAGQQPASGSRGCIVRRGYAGTCSWGWTVARSAAVPDWTRSAMAAATTHTAWSTSGMRVIAGTVNRPTTPKTSNTLPSASAR